MKDYSLHDVVTELIQHQRRTEGSEVLGDEDVLFHRCSAVDDLLSSPCTVFMDADRGEMRGEAFQHGYTGPERALFEQFLNDLSSQSIVSPNLWTN